VVDALRTRSGSPLDLRHAVREEIPLYETEISWVEPVGDRRVVPL